MCRVQKSGYTSCRVLRKLSAAKERFSHGVSFVAYIQFNDMLCVCAVSENTHGQSCILKKLESDRQLSLELFYS